MSKKQLFPLVKAIEQVTGRRVHLSTALRWSQRRSGARLETVMLGGRRCCTLENVHDFIQRRTIETAPQNATSPIGPLRPEPRVRDVEKKSAQLEKELG